MSPHDPVPGAPAATPEPLPAKSSHVTASILPVVLGSVLAGLVAVLIEKRDEKRSTSARRES